MVGLLHDIDFELYPEEHCIKAPELLREGDVGEEMIHAICSYGYGITVDVKPEHLMEKVLYATGWFLMTGTGVPKDERKGLKWIHKATFQGYQPAIDLLVLQTKSNL